MKTVGIVLAGGLSQAIRFSEGVCRIGRIGISMSCAVDALAEHCDEVIVVTRPELIGTFSEGVGYYRYTLNLQDYGPLAGILSAMESVEADRYIVLPCDMPYHGW